MLDTKIDFTYSGQYTLTFRLDTDGFSFAVSDPSADEAAPACEDWAVDESLSLAANLKRAFAEKDWLARPFRRVNVLMATRRFTLMPLELFEDEQAAEVFYYNHPRWRNEEVRYNILHNNNLVVLFGIDQSVSGFLRERLPDVRLYTQASPLLDGFAVKSRLGNTRKMYVHVRRECMDVFCYGQGRFLLGNSYACSQEGDRLYALLGAWTSLGFDQEQDELLLCGRVSVGDEWVSGLKQFVRKVSVMPSGANMDFQMMTICE